MKITSAFHVFGLACAAAIVLVACGGGSSGSAPQAAGTASASAPATSTASGVLSAFGSVIVNGEEFATSSATAVADGDADDAATTLSTLLVGMMVDVDASGGSARRIRFSSAVRGEVDAVDAASGTLTVLGQTVQVSGATLFAGSRTSGATSTSITGIGNIDVGDYVIVYGVLDCTSAGTAACSAGSAADSTTIQASLVEEPAQAGFYRVEGYAQNAGTGSFMINGLTVDITSTGATATTCVPSPCAIADGQFVAVRATTAPVASAGKLVLSATRITAARAAPVLVAGATVLLEGPVAQLDTATDTFYVRGVAIDGAALASTLSTLSNGQIVEVTGTVDASGAITATAIHVEQHSTFAITAPLAAQSASPATLTLLGQVFTVNGTTRFVDRVSDTRPFNATNFTTVLALQNQLVVSGYATASGNIATRVERIATAASPTVAVQGIVTADSASAGTVTIGGVTASLGSSTSLFYPGAGSTPSLAGFFSSVTVQSSVAAVAGTAGSATGSIVAANAAVMPSTNLWAFGPP